MAWRVINAANADMLENAMNIYTTAEEADSNVVTVASMVGMPNGSITVILNSVPETP